MPVQKTNTVLSNNITLTAGGGNTTSSVATTTVGWHKMVHLKFTNGATPPATVASAIIEGSPDNSNWYTYQSGFNGSTLANGVSSYSVLVFSAIQYVRVTWTAGDTQNVTARAEVSEALEIGLAELVSISNSSTTPLGSNAVFTGTNEDISLYNAIEVYAYSDKASATNGLQLEYSSDGANWDIIDSFSVSASTPFYIQTIVKGQYFRVIYTNGAIAQTVFRLQIKYKSAPGLPVIPVGTSDTTAVTVQGHSSGVPVPISGSVTASGTVTANAGTGTFTVAQTNLATADYDTGAGTQTESMIGIALPASGGAVAGGTSSNPIRIDPTGTTTQPVSGTVTAQQSTATNLKGTIQLLPSTQLTSASVSFSASGDNTIVSAVAAQVIKVYRIMFTVTGAVNITFKNGSTALSGAMPFAANGGIVLDFSGEPWWTCSTNTAFIINLSTGTQVSGQIWYIQA